MKLNELFYWIKKDCNNARERRVKYDMVRMLLDRGHRDRIAGLENDVQSLSDHRDAVAEHLHASMAGAVAMDRIKTYLDDFCNLREEEEEEDDYDEVTDDDEDEDEDSFTEEDEDVPDEEDVPEEDPEDETLSVLRSIDKSLKTIALSCSFLVATALAHATLVLLRSSSRAQPSCTV
jgi:hypothetical protein